VSEGPPPINEKEKNLEEGGDDKMMATASLSGYPTRKPGAHDQTKEQLHTNEVTNVSWREQ